MILPVTGLLSKSHYTSHVRLQEANMRKVIFILLTMGLVCFLGIGGASAYDLTSAAEITVYDNNSGPHPNDSSWTNPWWANTDEDEETEPGTLTGQHWDLEGMFIDVDTSGDDDVYWLRILSGFNFADPPDGNAKNGSIFIDTDLDADFFPASSTYTGGELELPRMGYEKALIYDFAPATHKMSLFDLSNYDPTLYSVKESINGESNPWDVEPLDADGNTALLPPLDGGLWEYRSTDVSDTIPGDIDGAYHYLLSVNITQIVNEVDQATPNDPNTTEDDYFYLRFHNTMECGNDMIKGIAELENTSEGNPVPLPGAFWLLISGAVPFILIRRRRK